MGGGTGKTLLYEYSKSIVCVCVCACVATINCQSAADPPPLSSSDRIPQVLGFVFQTAVGAEEKQTGRRSFGVLFTFLTLLEENKLCLLIFTLRLQNNDFPDQSRLASFFFFRPLFRLSSLGVETYSMYVYAHTHMQACTHMHARTHTRPRLCVVGIVDRETSATRL